eukprot:5749824-Amphidinium_carterae.1
MGPCGFTTFSIECSYFDTTHTAICGKPERWQLEACASLFAAFQNSEGNTAPSDGTFTFVWPNTS